MNNFFILCLLLLSTVGLSQNESKELQKEINNKVWKPFQMAFETLDGEALNTTYADKVLRVTPSGIDTENSFKTKNLERFEQNKKDGVSVSLDFWFDSRHTNQGTSYEVGFYRIGFKDGNDETSYSYGQFHIVIEKLDGQWKITQDWDTDMINGKKIDAGDFEKQMPLTF